MHELTNNGSKCINNNKLTFMINLNMGFKD